MASKKFFAIPGMALLLVSCFSNSGDDKFIWTAAVSGPANYLVAQNQVFFYSNGALSLNTGATMYSPNWGSPNDLHGATVAIPLPDSVYVAYNAMNDRHETWKYQGGVKLPKEKLVQLFEAGYTEGGEKRNFNFIKAGFAPGGRVCIWADHVEIMRFTVQALKKIDDGPVLLSQVEEENAAIVSYLEHHPVAYSIWEKPDKRYELDFGFTSRDGNSDIFDVFYYSKEGLGFPHYSQKVEATSWEVPYGQHADKDQYRGYISYSEYRNNREKYSAKSNLPVHMLLSWKNKVTGALYSTNVPMPKNLEERFIKPYTNPETGETAHYNRIVIGVEADGEHAVLWLDGPGKQEKLMRFKSTRNMDTEAKVLIGGYAEDVVVF